MDIKLLDKEKYQGYHLDFSYISEYYYDLKVYGIVGEYKTSLERKKFDKPFVNPDMNVDFLYADYFPGARAYGLEKGGKLIAVIELFFEEWSGRMRVTELWIDKDYRRRGIGRALMDKAKKEAADMGARLLMLETQTSNANAIAFYLAQGLNVIGYDVTCYGNNDIERGEVRLELGCKINK